MPAHIAGTEIYVAALATGLMQKGHEIAIIKPNYNAQKFTSYEYEGIKVLEYPESPYNDKDLQTGKKFPQGISSFKAIIEREQPNVIHFHELSGSNGITIQHLRVANELKIPIYFTFHLTSYVAETGRLLKKKINIKKQTIQALRTRGLDAVSSFLIGNLGIALQQMGISFSSNNSLVSLLNYPYYMIRQREIVREIFRLSEKVFVLNNWFKETIIINGLPEEKIVVMPQALPFGSNKKIESNTIEKVESNTIKFVFIGRICKIKGLYFLLKSLDKITNTNWTLDIYGNVTEENYYQKCKALSKDNNRIQWNGIIQPAEVVSVLQDYSVLVFPTMVQEMAPLIIQESFDAGVPIIASDVFSNVEQIKHGENGWLFPIGNKKELIKILDNVINNPSLIKEAKTKIPKVKTFEEVVEKHEMIYQQSIIF